MTMIADESDDDDRANDDLVARFVDCVVTSYAKTGLPIEQLAGAMLAKAVNLTIEELGAVDCARFLAGLAHQIFPVDGGGHA